MRRFLLATVLVSQAYASFCGDSAIPFSFEVLPDGQPVLGCARPTCFGWSPSGLPASQTGNFYRINKRPDGFMRNDRATIPPFSHLDARLQRSMTAECEATYQSNTCDPARQWVGGIAPLLNVSAFPTVLQCCNYEVLRASTDRGVAVVNPGQIVVGGEVMRAGKQYAFDYIADVVKSVNGDGTVSYDVSIRRMPCLALADNFAKNGEGKNAGAFRAFQAPNVAQPPINVAGLDGQQQGVQGPFQVDQNGVVEDTVADQAVVPQSTGPQAAANNGATVQFYEARPIFGPLEPVQAPIPQVAAPAQFVPVAPQAAPVAPAAPAAPAYYYPSYYYGSGGGGGGYYCFTDDTILEKPDGSSVRMDELKRDDWVKTIHDDKVVYTPVSFWLHRVPSQEAEFMKLTLENGKELKLTAKHYIYKTKCSAPGETVQLPNGAVFADMVNEGDCLFSVDKETVSESKVVKVEKVTQTGIYAPMTSNGKLVVNGVFASCHNIVQQHELQRTFFSYLNSLNDFIKGYFTEKDVNELPYGMGTIVQMLEFALPKNMF
ncbi:unnamed protein product, partial [Mesorhabditis spiculigera]